LRILILGATGNFANAAARLLLPVEGVRLRLASHREAGCVALRVQFPGTEICLSDWNDSVSLAAAVAGIDKLLIVTPDFETDEVQVAINLTQAVIAAGGQCHIVRTISVRPGARMVDLDPRAIAIRCATGAHLPAKAVLDVSGLRVTYLNILSWVMFNLAFVAAEVQTRRRIAMPARYDMPRAWVSEADIVEMLVNILLADSTLHAGQEYRIIGSETFSWRDVAETIGQVLGEPIGYADEGETLAALLGRHQEAAFVYFEDELRHHSIDMANGVDGPRLLGRPLECLKDYVRRNVANFTPASFPG
jgi:NAD(P)H dehydrogenase (quinone)